jgi:hypothetical protein
MPKVQADEKINRSSNIYFPDFFFLSAGRNSETAAFKKAASAIIKIATAIASQANFER